MPRYKKRWERGDKSTLARLAGISPQYLCDIMSDRKQCSARLAVELEAASRDLGYQISKEMWCWPHLRKNNPLFPQSVDPVTD